MTIVSSRISRILRASLPISIFMMSLSALSAASPVVTFETPSSSISVVEGSNLYVEVSATDADGIARIILYKDGVKVRGEGIAPYEWGLESQNDFALQNLSVGSFVLRAEAIDGVNDKGEASITVTVTADPSLANRPNLLFITADQFRYDLIRSVQNDLARYNGKTKIETPNLDRLRSQGVYFKNAYTQSAVCGPARSVFRTGNTLERNGVQSNDLTKSQWYEYDAQFKNKIEANVTFEQILVEDRGYVAEHMGKWHMPEIYNYSRNGSTRIMRYNDVTGYLNSDQILNKNYGGLVYRFDSGDSSLNYKDKLIELAQQDTFLGQLSNVNYVRNLDNTQVNHKGIFGDLLERNTYSKFPYITDAIDSRYKNGAAYDQDNAVGQSVQHGRNLLPANRTSTYIEGVAAIGALRRLAASSEPFVLTASFHSPHTPTVAAGTYYDYYISLRDNFFLPPSISGNDLDNSAWKKDGSNYQNPEMIKEWMAAYYGLCHEIDIYVGELLDTLDEYGIADNTLVVFASDHGESLGAHGRKEKNTFLEESAHIPFLMRFPGVLAAGQTVEEPITTLDLHATILDYLDASAFENSDGQSLRRFIEKKSYNKDYDESHIVTEWDFRTPQANGTLDRSLGGETNFLSLKGKWKLMLTKQASSSRLDMLYNLENDPYEMNNLVGNNGLTANDEAIGKAEHLKILLVEWMQRMDGGSKKYYSDPIYNKGEGLGDIAEVNTRRKWRTVNIWVSDTKVDFGTAVDVGGQLTRNEYVYLGRTNGGTLNVSSITVEGADAGLIQLSEFTSGNIASKDYRRVKMTYRPTYAGQQITDARLVIRNNAGADRVVVLASAKTASNLTFLLGANQRIYSNEFLLNEETGYKLTLQGDGNLVLRDANSAAIWSSNSAQPNPTSYYAVLQGDGNFLIREASTNAWIYQTYSNDGAGNYFMALDGDILSINKGNDVNDPNLAQMWANIRPYIQANDIMQPGEIIRNSILNAFIILQSGGNLVCYEGQSLRDRGPSIWSSKSSVGAGVSRCFLKMRNNDGTAVIVEGTTNNSQNVIWSAYSGAQPGENYSLEIDPVSLEPVFVVGD